MKLFAYVGATALVIASASALEAQPGRPGGPGAAAAPTPLSERIAQANPASWRESASVHAGSGPMSFGQMLGGADVPGLGFIHRGIIPPGGGIGHHFHLSSEEMFVILNEGEAQFTINGRTSKIQTPAGVPVQLYNSHALVNTSNTTLQWLNISVNAQPAYAGGSIDLGDDRVGAPLDEVPNFVVMSLDKTRMGQGNAQHGADASVQYRRALQPAVFRTPWTYADHLVIPPGASTKGHLHTHISEVYYVIGGQGIVRVNNEEASFTKDAAIPIRAKEVHSIRNTGNEPLEILIIGIADDMTKNTETIATEW